MNKRQLTLITLITILSLYSCKKELSDLGSDLIPSSQKFVFSTDTLKSIELSTVSNPYCSFLTYNDEKGLTSTMLIGSYNDSRFGNITSDCITQVYPPSFLYSTYKNISLVDSVVLYLTNTSIEKSGIQTYIGDANQISNFNISYLKESIQDTSSFKLDDLVDLKEATPFFNFQSNHSDTIKLKLPIELGEKLIAFDVVQSTSDSKDTTIFSDMDKYRKYFKGLYFGAEKLNSGGSLLKYSLLNSFVKVHCIEKIAGKDSAVFKSFSLFSKSRNLIKRDFSTADFVAHIDKPENDTVAYTSTLNGPMIEISKDTLENWKKRILKNNTITGASSNIDIAVNRAEILVYPLPESITQINGLSRVPRLMLSSVINNKREIYNSEASYVADKGAYIFNITSLIHQYLRDDIKPDKLIISADYFDPNASVELFNDKRVILYNNTSSKSPVILISYTKLQ